MSNIIGSLGGNVMAPGVSNLLGVAKKYLPTPSGPSLGTTFGKTLQGVANVGSSIVGGVSGDVYGDLRELLALQAETQGKMQSISMLSNIERSKHESRMAAIRNVRTG